MMELLSPAGGMEQLRAALHLGADTVYGGVKRFGLRANAGNFDWDQLKEALSLVHGAGKRFYLTHGHLLGVKASLDSAVAAAASNGADVLLYGHTHLQNERYFPSGTAVGGVRLKKPMLVVCPGSLGQPPDGHPSFATLTLRGDEVMAGFGQLPY